MKLPISDKTAWALVGAGSAMVAGAVVQNSLEAGYRRVTHEEAPWNPESPDTGWREAILLTLASAVAVGIAQLLARRGAAAGWKQTTGKRPPQ